MQEHHHLSQVLRHYMQVEVEEVPTVLQEVIKDQVDLEVVELALSEISKEDLVVPILVEAVAPWAEVIILDIRAVMEDQV